MQTIPRPVFTRPAQSVSPGSAEPPPVLRLKRVARVSLVITGVFTAGIFLPGLFGANMMNWGFAAAVFSGFLAMIGFVTTVIYRRQARELAVLFSGADLLAVWSVPEAQWLAAVDEDWKEERQAKRNLWYIVLGWCVVIGIGFVVLDPGTGSIVLLILLGVAALCGLAAVAGPGWRRRRQIRSDATVRIGRRGVYCGGIFHDWSLPGSALRSVQAGADPAGGASLHLTYDFITRAGLQTEAVRIPVPPGHEADALRAADALKSSQS